MKIVGNKERLGNYLPASKWSLYFSLFHEQNDMIAMIAQLAGRGLNLRSTLRSCCGVQPCPR